MKKLLLMIIGLTLVIASCEKPIELDKYYLGEKFTISVDEPAIVVDTSTQFFNNETEEWQYPEYLVEVKSLINENRCPPNLCSVCFGGFVELECSVTNVFSQVTKKGIVDYPSCTENDLSINGSFGKTITINELNFKCLAILPYYDLPEEPSLKDYQIKFIGLK